MKSGAMPIAGSFEGEEARPRGVDQAAPHLCGQVLECAHPAQTAVAQEVRDGIPPWFASHRETGSEILRLAKPSSSSY